MMLAIRVFNYIQVSEVKFVIPKAKFDLNKKDFGSEKLMQFCPLSDSKNKQFKA